MVKPRSEYRAATGIAEEWANATRLLEIKGQSTLNVGLAINDDGRSTD